MDQHHVCTVRRSRNGKAVVLEILPAVSSPQIDGGIELHECFLLNPHPRNSYLPPRAIESMMYWGKKRMLEFS